MTWAPAYITEAELRAWMRVASSAESALYADAAEAASRAIDRHCNRQFGQTAAAEARTYTAWWNARLCRWVVTVDDFQDPTGLTVTVPAGTVDVVAKKPANAVLKGKPYTYLVVDKTAAYQPTGLEDEVTVTVKWGWLAVPNPVKVTAKLQGSRFASRRDSPYGVAGSPDLGNELRLLAKVDADLTPALTDYVRPRRVM
jgi:hypothetical protein